MQQFINGPVGFQAYNDFSTFGGSTSKIISFTGAPCSDEPCCYIIACDAWGMPSLCNGPITVTSSFYDGQAASPSPSPAPSPGGNLDTPAEDPAVVGGSIAGVAIVGAAGAALWYNRRRLMGTGMGIGLGGGQGTVYGAVPSSYQSV